MIARLIEFSLSQRLLVLILIALLAGAGLFAARGLPIDAFPDVSPVQVNIVLKAPGMTPEEVESRIAAPIEVELLGLPGKQALRSTTKYGLTSITVVFDDSTDIYWARNQVAERLQGVRDMLPPGVQGGLAPITTPLGEIVMFTIEGPASLAEKRSLLDWVIRPALRTVPGVADVNSLGGFVETFEVVPDLVALGARGVSLDALKSAIAANNRNDGAGRLTDGEEALLVRSEGSLRSLDDLRAVVIATPGGTPVRVGDVAQVRDGGLTRYGAVTRSGKGETVEGLVLGLRGSNAQAVVEGVRQRLAELKSQLPQGISLTVFYDRGELVDHAVGTVTEALLIAVALVLVLLILFLGEWRAALVVSLTLPLAALATFLLMRAVGLTANLMSLGGLAIAIGLLVDGAVVVVENAVERLNHAHGRPMSPLTVIYRSMAEVTTPVVAGVSIIVVVFLPLLSLEGLEGKLFRPVALAIMFALGASLLLSLTAVPVLSSLILKPGHAGEPWLIRHAGRLYAPLIRGALARPARVFIGAGIALAAALAVFPLVGKTFMPTMDEGTIVMQTEKLPTVSLAASTALDTLIQRRLLEQVPEVTGIVSRVGSDELGLDPMGLNEADNFLTLKPQDQWRRKDKAWLLDQLRLATADIPGISFGFTQPIDMRVQEMVSGSRGDLVVKIKGTDIATLNRLAADVAAVLKELPGSEDVLTTLNEGMQYLTLRLDPLAVGRLGLTVDTVEEALRSQLEGTQAGSVVRGNRRTPILVRGPADLARAPQAFANLTLPMPDGRLIPLSAVGRVERVDGPVLLSREEAQRQSVVRANVRGRDLVGYVADARAAIAAKVSVPAGYELAWGGQFENQQRAAARLAIVVPCCLVVIFVILYGTFGAARQALLVLGNVPFALVGGIISLWLSGEYLSVPASVGFIALLGIAVLNGVVLVACFNQLLARGVPIAEAVLQGARRRLRPVLMTATIAAFGLLPLLFQTGPGSEVQRPLAIVVVGGLVSSTVLTLLVLPALYQRFGLPRPRRVTP
ncbi:CusA/CzcA family heavy metal efflux RND transporter [Nitrospirillum sp. BR 11163]|uniref:efflux RND transporter permease subunit n=1 Tax=Nitrospirillum sp. BR 11163 TaxID=3104323 RepID=UPI002AFFF960|nr:CusA/CzcA family heavy metal efflux RND transporter [Nitrospirillum sp. BR 11163]MEA1674688.1 CusA/CzcA family heavy metal efflux RND transporter [Nitrospirillum sp. BR 11163]